MQGTNCPESTQLNFRSIIVLNSHPCHLSLNLDTFLLRFDCYIILILFESKRDVFRFFFLNELIVIL